MTRVCATAAVQLDPDVISRRKSVPRSFGLVPFPRAHRYTGITNREVIPFGNVWHVRKFEPRALRSAYCCVSRATPREINRIIEARFIRLGEIGGIGGISVSLLVSFSHLEKFHSFNVVVSSRVAHCLRY